ncbi:sugar phosphate nucleotidyltransferase [Algoriphagus sp. CAU 1675]|uniref:sugar phosphate nucleotidyltransferase n=1 Tax=Algoriphagus sp. CAU 1675 TaxID=3032597 RepID=UPI0023DB2582|nr:sugar phosphate nucleotidyltransferase [Algoriphagus sp. CAU 1675]MDF2158193.1 sugar phosphate nucleotidyltransferase [Algoriphagus sp. CAU 1675]
MKDLIIDLDASIKSALKKMDDVGRKLLIILDKEGKFFGLISIGDIQRAILKNLNLDLPVFKINRATNIVGSPLQSMSELKNIMINIRAEFMPIINEKRDLVKVIYWNELFPQNQEIPINKFNLPVIIMAGGQGNRLKPLTNIIPKPLIPFGEKTMLEEIFNRFNKYGSNNFYLSVNYKFELIQFYLEKLNLPFIIEYFKEDQPLGTAGSLYLLKNKLNTTFFVTNCDILIDQDYNDILKYHYEEKNEITLVSVLKSIEIPYGTLEINSYGRLKELKEKPSYDFMINSGMYILEPHLLHEIPENQFFHITHLIDKLINEDRKVGVFPVSDNSWKDVGQWDQYIKFLL